MKRRSLRPKSIFLYILLPLLPISAAIVILTLALASDPLRESYAKRQETSLLLATRLGLDYCEELFRDLLSLRLSDDPGMVQTSREEALHRIVALSRRFSDLHTAAVDENGTVVASSLEELSSGTQMFPLPKKMEKLVYREIGSEPILLHARYFPFWRWHIVAFAFESTLLAPVRTFQKIIAVSLSGVLAVLLLTVLITIQYTVKRPLAGIIGAAARISRGEFPQIENRRRDEIGRVTDAVNNMVEGLQDLRREADAAMQRLAESERRFRRIVENSQAGYFFLDPEGRVRRVNAAWLRLYGYSSPEEVEGTSILRLQGRSAESEKWTREQLETLRRGISIPSGEAVRFNRDGTQGFHLFSATPVYRGGTLEGFEGFVIDTTERIRYQEALEHSLSEKEVLLQEIHHRVKNNLNVVVSLLNLQEDRIEGVEDARRALLNSRDRIFSMALVHENLYHSSSLAAIDLRSYLSSMINQLFAIYAEDKQIDLELKVEKEELDITQAVPCALILNELITNSLQHAYPERNEGRITVSFRNLAEHTVELVYRDDGIGLTGNADEPAAAEASSDEGEPASPYGNVESAASGGKDGASLGMKLIQVLSNQLEGDVELSSEEGIRFRLVFPDGGKTGKSEPN